MPTHAPDANPRTARLLTLLILGTTLCPPLTASADDVPRSISELPTLGGDSAIARAINQHGTVLGEMRDGRIARNIRDSRAAWKVFIIPLGGSMKQLEQFAGLDPMLINDRNVVVGERFSSIAQRYAAFMWTADGGTVNLPAPAGARFGHPVDLDNAGNVLMNVGPDDDAVGHLLLTADARFVDLPCLAGHRCRAIAMNEAGAIVGVATERPSVDEKAPRKQPVLWDAGTRAVSALPASTGAVEPVAINARGTILGRIVGDDGEHVVAWRGADHRLTDFGIGSPVALNNRDVAAGMVPGAAEDGLTDLPALWDLSRGTRSLLPPRNPQDDRIELADLNDAGDVVGTAYDADGNGHPVLYRGYAPVGVAP
jgi:hypothetical protein